jgi:hypothetical protein
MPSLTEVITRVNQFISKVYTTGVSETSRLDFAKIGAQQSHAIGDVEQGVAKAKNPEPTHVTLEEALVAGQQCHKCNATKVGTKGVGRAWVNGLKPFARARCKAIHSHVC